MSKGTISVAVLLVFLVSWSVNLYKLVKCDFSSPYKCEVIHGIGLIPLASPIIVWFETDA